MTASLEETLCRAYEEEAACYARALQIAGELAPSSNDMASCDIEMNRLLACLDEVRLIEARIAVAKQAWHDAGRTPGPELRERLAKVAGLIQEVAARVEEAQQHARLRADRLAPQLDELIRGQHMRQAYTRSMSRSR